MNSILLLALWLGAAATISCTARQPLSALVPGDAWFQFDGLQFRLPAGSAWNIINGTGSAASIAFGRGQPAVDKQYISVRRIDFGPELAGLTVDRHVASVWRAERERAREPETWSDFQEGERQIGAISYPVMSFRVRSTAGRRTEIHARGLFLVLLPDDFQRARRFFLFQWLEHLENAEQAADPAPFDTLIASLRNDKHQP